MRQLIGLALALGLAGGAQAGTVAIFGNGFEAQAQAPVAGGKWVAGYYVGYESWLQPVSELDFDGLTHLMVGAVKLQPDGTLVTHFDIDDGPGMIWAQAAIDAAQAAGRKALLMIGGAGTDFRGPASEANRARFVTNLVALADQTGADGLDLDWEPLQAQDYAPFTALVRALREKRPNLLLTVPIGIVNANYGDPADEAAFWAGVVPYLDQINLMSYGMGYDYVGWHSWFSSPLKNEVTPNTPTSIDYTVAYYLEAGIPAAKLGVGSGFYGTCYKSVSEPRQPVVRGDIKSNDGAMSYYKIVRDYLPFMDANYDVATESPWLGSDTEIGPEKCTYVNYEDARSIAAKGAYVHEHGLGGTIIWTISQGHISSLPEGQRDPLLDAMNEAFLQPR